MLTLRKLGEQQTEGVEEGVGIGDNPEKTGCQARGGGGGGTASLKVGTHYQTTMSFIEWVNIQSSAKLIQFFNIAFHAMQTNIPRLLHSMQLFLKWVPI